MSELIFLSSGVQMTTGNKLLRQYFLNQDLRQKTLFLIGDKEPEWFTLCSTAFEQIGFMPQNIFASNRFDNAPAVISVDYIYMAEGNTFQQLQFIRNRGWIPFIRDAWESEAVYIGVSAGAHIACKSVAPAADFDNAVLYLVPDFSGLGFFNGVVIPHFSEDSMLRVNAKNTATKQFAEDRVLLLQNSQMAVIDGLKITIVELE